MIFGVMAFECGRTVPYMFTHKHPPFPNFMYSVLSSIKNKASTFKLIVLQYNYMSQQYTGNSDFYKKTNLISTRKQIYKVSLDPWAPGDFENWEGTLNKTGRAKYKSGGYQWSKLKILH